MPPALRAFLLTLAVVDDLGAIIVIAAVFTEHLNWAYLGVALSGLVLWAYLQHRRVKSAWVYIPLAGLTWTFMHASGIHPTVAGVAMGLLTRIRPDPSEAVSPAEHLEHVVRPVSAGLAVPVFAFLAAGVRFVGTGGSFTDIVVPAVLAAVLIGKPLGVFAGAYLTARFTRAELSPDLTWADVFAVAVLSGIGFTVSLLIGDLAFHDNTIRTDHIKIAVLVGSTASAIVASLLLRMRQRRYLRLNAGRTPHAG